MEYKYCTKFNFEHLASGRVLYGASGVPNFPVRLGNEIFRRCLQHRATQTNLTLYDPCCGGGYLLTVPGFSNPCISNIIGSDIDDRMLDIARRNFALLTPEGLLNRQTELAEQIKVYGHESHKQALESLQLLMPLAYRMRSEYRCED